MNKLKQAISIHKQLARFIADGKYTLKNNEKAIHKYIILGENIALALSEFKCENPKCKSEEFLTLHHLITKHNKKFISQNRYLSQRHYFFNIVILCQKCHNKVNNKLAGTLMETISENKIKEVKKEFEIGTK